MQTQVISNSVKETGRRGVLRKRDRLSLYLFPQLSQPAFHAVLKGKPVTGISNAKSLSCVPSAAEGEGHIASVTRGRSLGPGEAITHGGAAGVGCHVLRRTSAGHPSSPPGTGGGLLKAPSSASDAPSADNCPPSPANASGLPSLSVTSVMGNIKPTPVLTDQYVLKTGITGPKN